MKLSATNNPFFAQQVDRSRFPSLRITLLSSVAMALLVLALAAILFLVLGQFQRRILNALLSFGAISLQVIQVIPSLIMPVLSGLVAVPIWRAWANRGESETITAQQTVNGLILSVFYRMRILVAVTLITIPMIVLLVAGTGLVFTLGSQNLRVFDWRVLLNAFLVLTVQTSHLFQHIGLFIMGGVIGTVLAIKAGKAWLSAGGAFVITIALWAMYQAVTRAGLKFFTGWVFDVELNPVHVCSLSLLWLIPYAIAWIASRLARRWVQPST